MCVLPYKYRKSIGNAAQTDEVMRNDGGQACLDGADGTDGQRTEPLTRSSTDGQRTEPPTRSSTDGRWTEPRCPPVIAYLIGTKPRVLPSILTTFPIFYVIHMRNRSIIIGMWPKVRYLRVFQRSGAQQVGRMPPLVRTHLSALTTFPICYAICMRNPPHNNRKCGQIKRSGKKARQNM